MPERDNSPTSLEKCCLPGPYQGSNNQSVSTTWIWTVHACAHAMDTHAPAFHAPTLPPLHNLKHMLRRFDLACVLSYALAIPMHTHPDMRGSTTWLLCASPNLW
eukprot:1159708-Pelagomonas_calceolata.AAC.6